MIKIFNCCLFLTLMCLVTSQDHQGQGHDLHTQGHSCSPCLAPAPCQCLPDRVVCDQQQLLSLPDFRTPCPNSTHTGSFTANFRYNNISTIPAHAFQKLKMVGSNFITLFLDSNQISSIDDDAFKDIEDKLINLQLQSNNLSSFPVAIANLHNLRVLSLLDNNIHSLPPDMLDNIGNTLEILSLDFDDIHAWPHVLNNLTSLQEVTLSNMTDPNGLSVGAFANSTKLSAITFFYSNFSTIPGSLCEMRNVSSISMLFNQPLPEFSWPCKSPLPKLTSLTIAYSNISQVPNLPVLFPHLDRMAITNSDISSFSDDNMTSYSTMLSLDLHKNKLRDFPTGVANFPSLQQLFLSDNQISHIPYSVLKHLPHLRYLDMSKNRLHTIDDDAFAACASLSYVNLADNGFFEVPRALEKIKTQYAQINLEGNFISCNCELRWMRNWLSSTGAHVQGTCIESYSIMDYVRGDGLGSC